MDVIDPNARVVDLVGLLTVLNNNYEGKADLYELAMDLGIDIDDMMPIVYTASYLGFVTIGGGDIIISDKGIQFINSNIKERKRLISDSIKDVEPFKTAIDLKEFTLDELLSELERRGVQNYNSPQGKYDLRITLAEWGVYSGLISLIGEEEFRVNE
jgi:hypothetical protein